MSTRQIDLAEEAMHTRIRNTGRGLVAWCLGLILISATLLQGCSSSSGSSSSAGAAAGSTGATQTKGGTVAEGGSTTNGSTSGSGGAITTIPVGGSSATSAPATGGTIATGGTTTIGGTTRGTTTVGGGTTSSGGVVTGGTTKTGGTTAAGGTPGAGAPAGTTVSSSSAGGVVSSGGTPSLTGHYWMENINRGVVAVKVATGVYVSWRMFGYEYNPTTPTSVSYNLYRDGTKVASVTDSTNYLDASGTASSSYSVTPVIAGTEGNASAKATVWAQNYLRIPLSPPGSGYEANDASPGDLDGDGEYELVLKWQPSDAQDNANSGTTSSTYLDGIKLDGTKLWRIDLGPNIRSGAHYTQHSVYDFDGDGKAEIAVKTAPGTKDGTGAYLKTGPAASDDDSKVYRNSDGYILSGPEYLTVFSGQTGAELATTNYPVARGTVGDWGDDYGNRVDRFLGGAAFVSDGTGQTASGRPSIIQARGYYTRATISAYNWRDGALTKVWVFDSNGSGNSKAAGQGTHSMMVADVDSDGAQEMIYGAATIDSNGTFKCATGFGHGDALHVGELIPGKGIQVFMPHEDKTQPTYDVHDASTCNVIVKGAVTGSDNGRGCADDVDPKSPGAEFWSAANSTLYSATDGSNVGSKPSAQNFLIYWDGDETREIGDGASITKLGATSALLNASGCSGNNGTKNTPTLSADLLGDWREELVVRETNNTALRVYTTTDVTKRRIYTLMHDPTYRMQVSFQQAAYNQPPHTGFHIGSGMKDPPKPDIIVK
jgi:rhamnogalacturonan endolyase